VKQLFLRSAPPGVLDPHDPNHWKERVIHTFIFLSNPLLLVLVVGGLPFIIENGHWFLLAIALSAYCACIGMLFFSKKLPYVLRCVTTCLLIYLFGVAVIIAVGPFLASREWMLLFGIMAAILLGWPGATFSIILNTLTLIGVGILMDQGFWKNLPVTGNPVEIWAQVALDLFFINLFSTIFVSYLFIRIERSDRHARASTKLLEDEGSKLLSTNKRLENEILARKKAQDTVRKNIKQERRLLDSIAAGIIVVNRADKTLVYANSTALSLMGARSEEVIGQVCYNQLCPAETDACPILDLGQEIDCSERNLLNINGKTIPILKTVVPIEFKERECLLETFIDISDRKQLERKLSQAQKIQAIGTLAGGVAHDFNNILAAILGYTELSLLTSEKGTQQAGYLLQVQKACHRAEGLVKQILAFARQADEKLEPIRIDLVAGEVLKLLRSTIPSSIGIDADMNSPSLVMANSTQIHQVFLNLGTNAAQAMEKEGGVLAVKITDAVVDADMARNHMGLIPGDYLKIIVSDTGSGISEEYLDTIFEPYFTTKPIGKGTGLGLSVVHGIVKGLQGEISVSSQSGQGTCFTIHLPVTRDTVPRNLGSDIILPRGTEHILVVDDEQPLADMVGHALEQFGYTVTIYTDSQEALAFFSSSPTNIDAIITDMTMPRFSGKELSTQAKSIRPGVPVLLCTGYSKKIGNLTAAEIGVDALLMKPVTTHVLVNTLREILNHA
jgi:two-component system, cell cycle sensor histidine kinase and response regulator CckA